MRYRMSALEGLAHCWGGSNGHERSGGELPVETVSLASVQIYEMTVLGIHCVSCN
jgi:hypothetical protein